MKIDQKKVNGMFRIVANPKIRKILHKMRNNTAYTYTDVRQILEENQCIQGSVTAFYLKKCKDLAILRYDERTSSYYLTRVGNRILALVDRFEEFCTEYDMSDVEQDGKVRKFIVVEGQNP